MNRNKLSLYIALAAVVVVLAGGWFLGVQPQLASASSNKAQQSTIESTNATNRAELDRLQNQFKKLGDMKSDLASLQASIPSKADTESFIKAMNATADATGASITNIAIGDAQPYTSPNAVTTPTDTTATASASASASASPSASASDSPTPSPTPTGPTTVTNPAITGTNFTVIPVTVVVSGSYDQALDFTKGLQDGKRLFLINTLSSSTGGDAAADDPTAADSTWTLGGWIYVLDTASGAATTAAATTTTNG